MKKKRGKKKKVSLSKKIKRFFLFNNKITPIILIIALLALAILLILVNHSTGNVISGNVDLSNIGTGVSSSLNNPAPAFITKVTNFLGIGETWKQVLIGIIILLILFAGFYDILELTSIFSNNWVIALIAAGLAIIAGLIDLVRQIATWLFAFAGTLGAIGIFVEIVVCIVIFIGLSFGGSKIAIWAAKRKAQRAKIKAIKSSGDASAAIVGLRNIQNEFKKGV